MTSDKFKPEKMRRELYDMLFVVAQNAFKGDAYACDNITREELLNFFSETYPSYDNLLFSIQDAVSKRKNYAYDNQEFRVNLKKFSLFLQKLIENATEDNRYLIQFSKDIGYVQEVVDSQITILEEHYNHD